MRDFSIDLIWAKIQVAITAVGGWIGWFLGGVDGMLIPSVLPFSSAPFSVPNWDKFIMESKLFLKKLSNRKNWP
jgi:hypothetical protein